MRLTPFAHIVLGLLLALVGYEGFQAYRWKQIANERGYRADVAFTWLAQPVGKDANGKPVTRAAVLDAIAQTLVK